MTHLQSVFGGLSESNQQQQMSQQNQNVFQPMPTKPTGLFNQQSNFYSTQQPQPMQQPYNNAYLPINQTAASMPAALPPPPPPPPSYPSSTGCYLTPNVMDQLRSLTSNATPIFILPAGLSSAGNSSVPYATPCFSPTCIPYPMPLPIYHHFGAKSCSESDCKCTSSNKSTSRSRESEDNNWQNGINGVAWDTEHACKESSAGQVCSMKNCPASIQLQAMTSQLLGIQGVVPSAITRILLRRVPGSNIADSQDEIMDKATRCIRRLPKDGLVRESCNAREVTKLLSLYLTSSSTIPRIIPILTTVQLKCNVLKALVENLASSRLMEEKRSGVEANEPLDRLLLELKSEDDLRQILATLRERECEERVNVSFAACISQKRIAEARLASVQSNLQQVEAEMERRRDLSTGQGQCSSLINARSNEANNRVLSLICGDKTSKLSDRRFDSPDPFADIRVTSPKRLLLKPHVGSPETTYVKPSETCKTI